MSLDNAEGTQESIDQEMEAAFAASVDGTDEIQAEPQAKAEETEVEAESQEKTEEKATQPAPPAAALSEDQIKLLSAIPELERRLTQQVDRVAGNYGEVKRLLESMQKAAATPQSAAAFEASEDGDYLDRELPEIANGVKAKIDRAVSQIQTGITVDQFEAMYAERRTKEEAQKRDELISALDAAHPDRLDVIKTPAWGEWFSGLTDYQQASLKNSEDPYYVSGMLSKFKECRDKQKSASEKSKQRIASAVTPSGVRPTSPSTISEDEAAQKAFEDQFK